MISTVIVAGGKGKRMGMAINKAYLKLGDEGKEILALTVEAFNNVDEIDEIIIVTGEHEIEYCEKNIVGKYKFDKVKKIVAGGSERQESVYNGLMNCCENTDFVLIHDGARPFVTTRIIKDNINDVKIYNACTTGVAVKDTIKTVSNDMFIDSTLNREGLYSIQTPQCFSYELIMKAHKNGIEKNIKATDDNMLVEAIGEKIKIVKGDYFNIKITTTEDLVFGKAILRNINMIG